MYGDMESAVTLIRERLAKAEIKAARAEKAWETAKNEVSDLQTALRVMSELTGESAPTSTANVAQRQLIITRLLRVGEANAVSPSDLYEQYQAASGEDLNLDTFRTTIWRMKGGGFQDGPDLWLVTGDSGKYWKEPASLGTSQRYEALSAFGPGNIQHDTDPDDDVTF